MADSTVVAGQAPLRGESVMASIAELLDERLPAVPLDDLFRPALVALACADGCTPRALGASLSAISAADTEEAPMPSAPLVEA